MSIIICDFCHRNIDTENDEDISHNGYHYHDYCHERVLINEDNGEDFKEYFDGSDNEDDEDYYDNDNDENESES